MKPGKLFWGVAFLTAGILLMLGKLGVICIGFSAAWRFWPVILVLAGASMILGKQGLKAGAAGIAGLLLGLFVAAIFCTDWMAQGGESGLVEQEFSRPYDPAVKSAKLSLDAGVGSFTIAETCTALVDVKTSSSIGSYQFRTETTDSSAQIHATMEGHKPGWRRGGWKNQMDVRLNERPAWQLDLEVGAAEVDLDLRRYRLQSLDLEAGAATVTVRLGAISRESDVRIEAGASSVRLEVPEDAGCELRVEAHLSSKKFPGFTRVDGGVYRTENFDTAPHRITIWLEAGVSSLKVKRVEPA
jgi:hypothetical protein